MLANVNIITVLIICIFTIPIIVGIIRPLTSCRIYGSFVSLLRSLMFLAAIILTVHFTSWILSGDENFVLTHIYKVIPALQNAVENQEVWVSVLFAAVLLFIIYGILYLLMLPIFRYVVYPISGKISSLVMSMNNVVKHIIGGIWQLPKSVWLVLVFSILLNFYTGIFNSFYISEYANHSKPYQIIQRNVVQPLVNTSVVRNVEVIINDTFKAAENELSRAADQLVIYFNGVTLDEAVQSNSEIDAMAQQIVGSEISDKQKAYLIYKWICENIKYDNHKAEVIARAPSSVSSGAIVAFNTRTGICFDFSCLYVAMCRAVGLNVRFITGLGYTGAAWGDHAWNQVYDPDGYLWINVDTTFGSTGINYFDSPIFYVDHKDGVVRGEW